MESNSNRVPVTILTGFLGAGKTTLLNRILTENHGEKLAVIVNEFGAVGIDHRLIVGTKEDVVEMSNGCLCCTVRGDLSEALRRLFESRGGHRFSRVVIETSGLAEPVPIIQTFLADPFISAHFKIDAVVCIVDAYHFTSDLEKGTEVEEQIAFADVVIINKTDLVDQVRLVSIHSTVRSLNPQAQIISAKDAIVPIREVVGINAFDLETKLRIAPDFLEDSHHIHNTQINAVAIHEKQPLDFEKVVHWISTRIKQRGDELMRYKGILNIEGEERRVVFQGVHSFFEIKADRPWGNGEERESNLVLIGKNLNRKFFEESFKKSITRK